MSRFTFDFAIEVFISFISIHSFPGEGWNVQPPGLTEFKAALRDSSIGVDNAFRVPGEFKVIVATRVTLSTEIVAGLSRAFGADEVLRDASFVKVLCPSQRSPFEPSAEKLPV
jgi:hypothetical protein